MNRIFLPLPLCLPTKSVAGCALLAALLLAGCGGSDAPPAVVAAAAPEATVTAAPALETAQSALAKANVAFRENRIVEPAGNNALEHAMRALQIDPKNVGATEILVDLTPIAASAIEADISAGNFADAQRVMTLLAVANPGSLTVQSLQRRLATATRPAPAIPAPAVGTPATAPIAQTTELAATTSGSPQPAAATPASPTAAGSSAPRNAEAAATFAATTTAPSASIPDADASQPGQRRPAVTAAPTASAAQASEPVPLVKVAPDYPPAAKKRRTEGWVELQFLVGADGVPRQIEVTRAQPPGMFDRAAVRAMARWKFKPAERDGQAVEARAKTTVGFKLG